MKDVLGDYLMETAAAETAAAVQDLICQNPGITGSKVAEAMGVDLQETEANAKMQDQPMETEQAESSSGASAWN